MSLENSGVGRVNPRAGNVQALNDLRDLRSLRSRLRPKELVDLLLSHGARAWRASQPVSRSRIKVRGMSGSTAVRLSFGRPSKG
ncbi:hypothetical protein U0C82_11965 [Fulvimarina sp. 2208YS6-2-32]|uniref:Uncharacterized protein n=1 Tax=Fulvimarina uroteuthidis TaxID=3098149 RepID=A0ABU5I445_9HYPH|nr:hypothetical protein [Fulvimarina sp. 2208YS6-2-32]MDY8109855.1 hypothetical protein [Fulvimarina sp. 2208YS6-2-32]